MSMSEVLDQLKEKNRPLFIDEIEEELEVNKSTLYQNLRDLVNKDYIDFEYKYKSDSVENEKGGRHNNMVRRYYITRLGKKKMGIIKNGDKND